MFGGRKLPVLPVREVLILTSPGLKVPTLALCHRALQTQMVCHCCLRGPCLYSTGFSPLYITHKTVNQTCCNAGRSKSLLTSRRPGVCSEATMDMNADKVYLVALLYWAPFPQLHSWKDIMKCNKCSLISWVKNSFVSDFLYNIKWNVCIYCNG